MKTFYKKAKVFNGGIYEKNRKKYIYINQLIRKKNNGIKENHIIKIDFDERKNKRFQNPDVLDEYIRGLITDDEMYYLLLDEIQKVDDFESVLNGFLHIENLDIYVTRSNSKFLSSDIVTECRGRGDEIRVFPLSFSEFYEAQEKNLDAAWEEYITYGACQEYYLLKMKLKNPNILNNYSSKHT